jgi:hypothetical protein
MRHAAFALVLVFAGLPDGALAQAVLANATEGAPLTLTNAVCDTPMAVAYDPTFDRYYGAAGGSASCAMFVFSSAGTQLSSATIGVDQRGAYYNPATAAVEVVSFDANTGSGANVGIQKVDLDGSGNLLGTNTQLLAAPIAALGFDQTMPSFNPGANLLYAKQSGSTTINVVNRTTGASAGTITLALPGGVVVGDLNANGIGFTGVAGAELAIYDATHHQVLVYNLAGTLVGTSLLPAIASVFNNQVFGTAYANGFMFVWDDNSGAFGAWRRFTIFGAAPPAGPTSVPTLSPASLAFLVGTLVIAAFVFLRRKRMR